MLDRMIRRSGTLRSRLPAQLSAAVSTLAIASLVLAGCGGGSEGATKKPTGDDRPQSQPTQGGTELAALWPLTGLPAPRTTPKHPVMVVKIDNTHASEPQIGLS